MEKFNGASGDEEDYTFELQNFELKFFGGLHLFKRGVEWLVEQRHSALGDRLKQQPTAWSVLIFRDSS